ncbi:hypothetical protein SAY87_017244 [Trapa incisa]|uniref:Beta-galactosidase n=1 Tax=Trapa incisa TaxID=236973 RepID=A0AAN7L2Q7_9MYRT|nr:hypothetical protein SAY87_017244 [Trapa incisa]
MRSPTHPADRFTSPILPHHRASSAPTAKIGSAMVSRIRRRVRGQIAMAFFTLAVSLMVVAAFFVPVLANLPSLSTSPSRHRSPTKRAGLHKFEISKDRFWKDGQHFRIIGGDLHYFRVLPEYWEDRLLRARALGLNTIQTYVPWNLHEPKPGKVVFEGIADIESFLKLCKKLDLLVMLRIGPYICAEWDFGGFPAWLLSLTPALKLRSSDPEFVKLVESWWSVLLPKVVPHLYKNGGPVVMVQIENEYGSYGEDKPYLNQLVKLARGHLGNDVILYTTDGGTLETLKKGTVGRNDVFSAVDFSTGEEPWHIFKLQKQFNAPGKSPPLSSEFYTGWLTHWGEKIATTGADFTAAELGKILSRNGSAVLYMVHGGTNFGFYSGANTGLNEFDYKPDLTSYDYDAPISESGDVDNEKYKAIRRVIEAYALAPLPPIPPNIKKMGYGLIQLHRKEMLLNVLDELDSFGVVKSEDPLSMESVGQMFGFLLYVSEYGAADDGGILSIPKVHDRGQVFISCKSQVGRPLYVGTIERWSTQKLHLPVTKCPSRIFLYVLVENMGRINYGKYIFDPKGILSSVYLNERALHGWKMVSFPLHNLDEIPKTNHIIRSGSSRSIKFSSDGKPDRNSENITRLPAFYTGNLHIDEADQVKDTFISFRGWGKGVAFINDFNLGRYWPLVGPQCNLYVPAPVLRQGDNVVVVLELETPHPELLLQSVDHPDFTCGSYSLVESTEMGEAKY